MHKIIPSNLMVIKGCLLADTPTVTVSNSPTATDIGARCFVFPHYCLLSLPSLLALASNNAVNMALCAVKSIENQATVHSK